LKDYTVTHFAAEEAYQKSIGYPDFDAHKELHVKFIQTVLYHEKKMLASDFAANEVKSFAGILTAWLLYHVADADQQIGKYARQASIGHSHSDIVADSVSDVLHKMAGLDSAQIKKVEARAGVSGESIIIKVELAADISGWLAFTYPVSFIKNLVYSMMSFEPEVIDELSLSVLFELSNIISGTVCGQIAGAKGIFCDIKTPSAVPRLDVTPDERVVLDTGIGIVETDIVVNYGK
jgi:CheY-specific phosphatase CheX